jgi:hypothetical protein
VAAAALAALAVRFAWPPPGISPAEAAAGGAARPGDATRERA